MHQIVDVKNIEKNKNGIIAADNSISDNIRTNRTTITKKKNGRKTTVWIFQATDWLNLTREGNLSRKTEHLLIATQDNVIKIDCVKTKIA